MRKHKTKIINFDTLIGTSKALFMCLFEDCNIQFDADLPKRKNATVDICCPRCKRDFFQYWTDESSVIINFGDDYKRMHDDYVTAQNKRDKTRRKK